MQVSLSSLEKTGLGWKWSVSEERTDHSWCHPGHPDVHRKVGWSEILIWSDSQCTITRIFWNILPGSYRGTRTSGLHLEASSLDIMVTTNTIKRRKTIQWQVDVGLQPPSRSAAGTNASSWIKCFVVADRFKWENTLALHFITVEGANDSVPVQTFTHSTGKACVQMSFLFCIVQNCRFRFRFFYLSHNMGQQKHEEKKKIWNKNTKYI